MLKIIIELKDVENLRNNIHCTPFLSSPSKCHNFELIDKNDTENEFSDLENSIGERLLMERGRLQVRNGFSWTGNTVKMCIIHHAA